MERVLQIGSRDLSVTFDARLAERISLTVDDPAAESVGRVNVVLGTTRGVGYERSYSLPGPVHVLPFRQPGLKYVAYETLTAGGPTPSRYDLIDRRTGEIPFHPARRFKRADLAKVRMTFRAQNVAATAQLYRDVGVAGDGMGGTPTTVTIPGTVDNYLTHGEDVLWSARVTQGGYSLADLNRRNVPDGESTELWNVAVTGPSAPGITRRGDDLVYYLNGLFSDGDLGRTGWDGDITGTASLLKDGTVLEQTDLRDCDSPSECFLYSEVPAAEGAYTVNVSARRDVPHAALSTAIDTSWTFNSAHTDENTPLAVPSIRYTPKGLDIYNRAEPGSVTEIPIAAHGGEVGTPRIEASFDDGATWQDLQVRQNGEGWTTSVTNPATPGHVTLRATATGPGGVRVKQTITRAYAVQN